MTERGRRRSSLAFGLCAGLLLTAIPACGGVDAADTEASSPSLSADGLADELDNPLASDDCQRYSVPVTLVPGGPSSTVVGWLCGGRPLKQTVLLLVHGATYDHNYWDFPLRPDRYSFVRRAREAGYATFNIDRLGDGLSDHPIPETLTIESGGEVVHQLVTALRSGSIRHRFAKVVLVGHSMGTGMILSEAATYNDADGVVATGLIHRLNPVGLATASSSVYPSYLDPQFAAYGYPPGYLTTLPGSRGTLFYYAPTADPAIVARDEALKQTVTDGELGTIGAATYSPASVNIHVPVMDVVGQFDSLGCGEGLDCTPQNVAAYEAQFFSSEACLETRVIANTGHDLNLHTTAGTFFREVIRWLDRRVGSSSSTAPTVPCL